jgi:hypothetical protein
VAGDGGAHSFSATLKTVAVQSITATDTFTSSIKGTQSGITVNPAAASTMIVSGYVSSTTAGALHSFTVTAKDAFGNTATGYTGTVTFTSTDSKAVLPANYTFVSGDSGAHSYSATLKTVGSQSITATDNVTSTIKGTQSGITVNPAAASTLVVSGYASPTIAGVSHSFTVTAKDAFGNTATGYLGTVHFTSSDGAAVLPADYGFLAGDGGAHSFSATLKTSGVQSITTANTTTSTKKTHHSITVNSAAASTLVVSAYPTPTTAGVSHNFTVTAKDAFGNTATGYTGTVSFSSTDAKSVLPGNYTFVVGDAGLHSFSATLKTARPQSITATDTVTGSIKGSQSGITVNAEAASKLVVNGFPLSTTAGVSQPVKVTAQDPFGNTATSYTGTIAFSSTDSQAVLPGNYTFVLGDAGAHTFSATLKTAGVRSITATDTVTGSITGTESGITVNHAAMWLHPVGSGKCHGQSCIHHHVDRRRSVSQHYQRLFGHGSLYQLRQPGSSPGQLHFCGRGCGRACFYQWRHLEDRRFRDRRRHGHSHQLPDWPGDHYGQQRNSDSRVARSHIVQWSSVGRRVQRLIGLYEKSLGHDAHHGNLGGRGHGRLQRRRQDRHRRPRPTNRLLVGRHQHGIGFCSQSVGPMAHRRQLGGREGRRLHRRRQGRHCWPRAANRSLVGGQFARQLLQQHSVGRLAHQRHLG